MPNLLTTLMPETAATPLQPVAPGASGNLCKTAFFSEGCQQDAEAVSFASALDAQLSGATSWLNLTAAGEVPAALLLTADGKALPLDGENLQPAAEADGDADSADSALAIIGMAILPPGMAPLQSAAVADGGDAPAVTLAPLLDGKAPAPPRTIAEGVVTQLTSTGKQPAQEAAPLATQAAGDTPVKTLLNGHAEAVAGDAATLRQGTDGQTLQTLVHALQGGEAATPSAAAVPVSAVYTAQATPAAAAASPLPQYTLDVPPGHPDWGDALGDRVNWMLNNHQAGAQLRLNPPHLGPLEIKVSVHNDQASVSFTAHHAVTADHLQAALPRLRELLADNGMQLAQFDVRHQGSGAEAQGGSGQGAAAGGEFASGLEGSDEGEVAAVSVPLHGVGLVDAYA